MRKFSLLIFLQCGFLGLCFGQSGKSSFYPEGYGELLNRKHVYSVGITTQNATDSFFYALKKEFGNPTFKDGYSVYRFSKPVWSKERIVVRIQHVLQTDLDKTTSNTLFIYAETKTQVDLLKPKTKSHERIVIFFKQLYNREIVNARLDNFLKQ